MSTNTKGTILAGRGLSKIYGNRFTTGNIRALDDASFELKEGEICGLVGPNGAGKSTLIKLIMGIEPRTSGTIEIDDNGPTTIIGYVPERPTFYEDLTAFYNLLYVARLNKVQDAEGTCNRLLFDVGLAERSNDFVSTFSKGMKQRLAIARALINSPKIIIMDEPFSGLDPTMMIDLRNHLKKLKGTGLTLLISSHELNEIDQVCDSLLFIKMGKIVKKEDFGRTDGKVNLQLVILNPGENIMRSLAGLKIISLSQDGKTIILETTNEDVPKILTTVIGAGAQIMESRVLLRRAEDMYADVYLKEAVRP